MPGPSSVFDEIVVYRREKKWKIYKSETVRKELKWQKFKAAEKRRKRIFEERKEEGEVGSLALHFVSRNVQEKTFKD